MLFFGLLPSGAFLAGGALATVREISPALRSAIQQLGTGIVFAAPAAIAMRLHAHPGAFRKTMVEKELVLDLAPDTVRVGDGLTMGVSYLAAPIVPLIAYLFLAAAIGFRCLAGPDLPLPGRHRPG